MLTIPSLQGWTWETGEFQPSEIVSYNEMPVWADPSGPLTIFRLKGDSFASYRLRLGEEVHVDILSGQRALVCSRHDTHSSTVDHFLYDQIYPRLLSHLGELTIHAGAVQIEDHAILLMGKSGSGKSTLTTSLDQAGFALLGDDAMVISWHGGRPCAKAVYPSLRLMPDSIEALLPEPRGTTPVAHYSSKKRINVSMARMEAMSPLPIEAIFAIGKARDDHLIELRRLTIAEACMWLVESSFALDPSDLERARRRLEEVSRLADRVPAFEISYPRDYSRLPDLHKEILKRLASQDELPNERLSGRDASAPSDSSAKAQLP